MAFRLNRLAPARLTYRYNDLPAQGFKVWSVLAGTSTLATTYINKAGATNTNPIVLDVNGQCTVWASVALDLIFCLSTSTGPTDGIIDTDPDFEYVSSINDIAVADAGTTNNNYVASVTPPYTTLPDGFSLVFIPDKDNEATLVDDGGVTSPKFTGTGINDLVFSGAYLGTTSGSIFSVEIVGDFLSPPGACTAAENVAAGLVTAGNHSFKITFVTAEGETLPGTVSNTVVAAGARKIDLSSIPVGAAGKGVTSRKIYMNEAGGADYYLADTIANNTATTLTINIADATLAGNAAAPTTNTTGDGTDAGLVRWKKDGGAWATVAITADPEVPQVMSEGVEFTFAVKTGHDKGDIWTQTVQTPARLNFCSLGSDIIYKNVDGSLEALGGGDLKQDIPAHLDWSSSQSCYILLNPGLPVLTEIQPKFIIQEFSGNHTVNDSDARHFLNCSNSGTITLPTCASFASKDVWIKSQDGSAITVNVAGGSDLIYYPFDPVGLTSIVIPSSGYDCVRLATKGVYWVVVEAITVPHGEETVTATTDWICPPGVYKAWMDASAGGGGGGESDGVAPGGGGGGGEAVLGFELTVVPGTTYARTIGAKGVGGSFGGAASTDGGNTSFAALKVLAGGVAGVAAAAGSPGTGGAAGGAGGQAGADGDATYPGCGGGTIWGPGGPTNPGATPIPGGDYGSGGAGGNISGDGADGAPGFMRLRW